MPSTAVADVGSPRRKSFCDPREPRYASATQPARLAGWAALHGLNVLRFACSSVYAFARKCPSFTARLAHRLSKLIRCWADFTKGPRLRQPSFGRQRGPIWLAGLEVSERERWRVARGPWSDSAGRPRNTSSSPSRRPRERRGPRPARDSPGAPSRGGGATPPHIVLQRRDRTHERGRVAG